MIRHNAKMTEDLNVKKLHSNINREECLGIFFISIYKLKIETTINKQFLT